MKPEEYKYNSDKNVGILESEIRELDNLCNEFNFNPKPFWNSVKSVNNSFKTLKPIEKNERERLWNKFQNLCEKAKSLQKEQNRNYESNSRELRSSIIGIIESADLRSKIDYSGSQEKLGKAMNLMKGAKLTKEDREQCWYKWKKVKDTLSKEKSDERNGNYLNIKDMVVRMSNTAAYGDPKEAMNEIKAIQSKLKQYPMNEVHWNEIKESLARYWNMAQSKLDEHYRAKQRDWESKQREYENKKANWRRNQETNLAKFERIVSDNEDFIDRLRDQIRDLENQIYDAWSDDWKYKARGWISEKESKISEVQSNISDLEYKINDIRRSLNE